MENPWVTINTRYLYENPWIKLREDLVLRPDGQEGIYASLVMSPSVGIVALDDRGRIALVEQWRYTHGRSSLEIPTGSVEAGDLDIQSAAVRELREETGISAKHWRSMGTIDNSNGITNEVAHLFLVTDLTCGETEMGGDEQLIMSWVPLDIAVDMASKSGISESTSVAAILRTHIAHRDL